MDGSDGDDSGGPAGRRGRPTFKVCTHYNKAEFHPSQVKRSNAGNLPPSGWLVSLRNSGRWNTQFLSLLLAVWTQQWQQLDEL